MNKMRTLDMFKGLNILGFFMIIHVFIFYIFEEILFPYFPNENLLMSIAATVSIIPISIYYLKNHSLKTTFKVKKKVNYKVVILAILLMLGINTLLSNFTSFIELLMDDRLHRFRFDNFIGKYADWEFEFWPIFYGVLVAPIIEELMYRGIIMNSIKRYSASAALIISALLFGSMHHYFEQFLYTFGVGLVLGFFAQRYSLYFSIFLHIFNNLYMEILEIILTYFPDYMFLTYIVLISAILCILIVPIIKFKLVKRYFFFNKNAKSVFFVTIPFSLIFLVLFYDFLLIFNII